MMKFSYFLILLFLFTISCEPVQEDYIPRANQAPSSFEVNHVIIDENSVTLSWTKSVDPDGDIVSYSLFKKDNTLIAEDLKGTFYVFSNLKRGNQYSGKIVADDGNGNTFETSYKFLTKGEEANNNTSSDVNNDENPASNSETLKIPSELKSYYKSIDFSLKKDQLKDELATLVIGSHTNFLAYRERHKYLKQATDPSNPSNLLLIYTGESVSKNSSVYNTEHIFPRSYLNKGNGEASDIHNFYYCRQIVNSDRANKKFTKGNGNYKNSSNYWYPGDDWRGDVARIIFYMNLRYDEPFDEVSDRGVALFLEWNTKDPVSEIEKKRNDIFQGAQGNRNPFIDNPYFATLIWGGEKAENRWK